MATNMPKIANVGVFGHFLAIFFLSTLSRKIFPSWILIGLLPITLFQMLNFHQSLPFLNWLFPLLPVPQDFPTRFSCKNFQQDFPKLDPDWLAPNHPIPNAKFPPITTFLKLFFSPPPCPARFSCKIFPRWILIGWLPITLFQMLNFHQSALLDRPTYHKSAKVSPPPFPQILWEPQINE